MDIKQAAWVAPATLAAWVAPATLAAWVAPATLAAWVALVTKVVDSVAAENYLAEAAMVDIAVPA